MSLGGHDTARLALCYAASKDHKFKYVTSGKALRKVHSSTSDCAILLKPGPLEATDFKAGTSFVLSDGPMISKACSAGLD